MTIKTAFETAINNLEQTNQMLCDYWLTELCDENGELIQEKMTEENLNLIEQDVMQQELDYPDDSYIMENDFAD